VARKAGSPRAKAQAQIHSGEGEARAPKAGGRAGGVRGVGGVGGVGCE
jgi:hypothetical protein